MFKINNEAIKDDARKLGLTLVGATLLGVTFKPVETLSVILVSCLTALGVIAWIFGVILPNPEKIEDDDK